MKYFVKYALLGFLCVGGHQIFEFLSLSTGNQIVYKIGLIISISSMYFALRSLEVLTNENVHSKIALVVIALVAVHAFSVDLSFNPYQFYLQHNSVFVWASAWMILFFYFHICVLRSRKLLKDDHPKRAMVSYLLATLDVSFILSLIYVVWGYTKHSVNVCTDAPSIWCTFFVVQILVLPWLFSKLSKMVHRPKLKTVKSWKETVYNMLISITLLLIFISILPFFHCLTLKFVFP